MKELSIEEKAKAYDEAKARMSRAFNSNRCTIGFMNEIFPEFRENWNERIRTKLIEFFSGYNTDEEWWGSITEKDILAWLEKQGDIPADVVLDSNKDGLIADTIRCKIEKQGEQKPAEWSEDDEKDFARVDYACLKVYGGDSYSSDWLRKFLGIHKKWKPSDAQMTALRRMKAAIAGEGEIYEPLNSLYEDLKKLRE